MRPKPKGRFVTRAVMLIDGEVPSGDNINRWREWAKRECQDSTETIDAIFDCALLGADDARDLNKEVNRLIKAKLRELVKGI